MNIFKVKIYSSIIIADRYCNPTLTYTFRQIISIHFTILSPEFLVLDTIIWITLKPWIIAIVKEIIHMVHG